MFLPISAFSHALSTRRWLLALSLRDSRVRKAPLLSLRLILLLPPTIRSDVSLTEVNDLNSSLKHAPPIPNWDRSPFPHEECFWSANVEPCLAQAFLRTTLGPNSKPVLNWPRNGLQC
ncbi:hypothetical protein HGRIS_000334 [Hohenbuehelia grisea]|uniref:Uncharacterized protein n=1 Tax=Hohenbuehelia grisea TaxID=104357 RepID=A0ABR3JQY1_9AGAR